MQVFTHLQLFFCSFLVRGQGGAFRAKDEGARPRLLPAAARSLVIGAFVVRVLSLLGAGARPLHPGQLRLAALHALFHGGAVVRRA